MALNLGELNAIIDGDDRGFNRTIDRVHKKMDATEKKMGSLTGMLRVLGKATAFSALATGAAGAASSIGPLIALVGTLTAALVAAGAAIPAFAAGGAAVIGTLTLAFSGLGDAIAGDEAALEALAGPAREFVSVVEDLKPAWEGVQQAVQAEVFDNLAGIFDEVAGNVLPHLEDGLVDVAGGLNEVAGAAIDAADLPQVLVGLDEILASTGAGLSAMAEGVSGWMRGLGILMSEFAPLLERAGVAAADLGERFGEWIQQAQQTGQLQELIQTMLDTLSTLGGIVSNLGSVFASVFGAASEAGGGLLGTIEDLTGQLATFFDSAQGQDALHSFFSALADVADDVIPIILELADAIATDLAPHFATIANEVGPSLRDLVREIGDAIGGIDIATLADGFADVLGAIIPLVGPLGDFLGWASQIEGLVPVVVGALVLWTVAQWALNAAMYANPIVWIIGLVIALIAVVVLIIANFDTVTAFLAEWWPYLLAIFTGGLSILVGLIIDNWDAIWSTTKSIFSAIGDFFVMIWDWLVDLVQSGVQKALDIIGWFADLPGNIADWFGSAKDAAVSKLVDLVNWVNGLPGDILDALGDLGSLMLDKGEDIISGLLNGMKNMAGAIIDWIWGLLEDLGGAVADFFGIASPSKLMRGYGENIGQGLAIGIKDAVPAVARAFDGLTTGLGLSVDGAAAPAAAAPPMAVLSAEDRRLLAGAAATRGRTDQTFNVYQADTDTGTLAHELDWLSRRRP